MMRVQHQGAGWQATKWGHLATLEYGKSLRDYEPERSSGKPYRVFGTNGPIGWHSSPLCKQPSVVVGRKGAYRGIHFSPDPFFVIDTAFYLNPTSKFDIRWAYYQLKNFDINKLDSGSAIPSTSRDAFYEIPVALPPLATQRRIAGILSAYDELIENSQRRIKVLESMARALYREWFVHFRFPGHESAAFIDSEIGDIPKGWSLKALSSVGTLALGGTPSRKVNAYWSNGDIPWLKSGALNATRVISASEYITKDALASSATKLLPRKAVVVAITGAILVSYLEIEACANQSVIGIYNLDGVGSEYLHLLLEQNIKALENLMTGSAQQHINKEVLGAVKILVPPASVMNSFSDQATPIYEQISALLFASENLRRTRDLLLPRLISGELDVESSAA